MVQNKIKTDGLFPTVNAVMSKLSNPMTLGYSNAGVVIEVGSNVNEFKVGDRVISNGHHSEVVAVNKNLVAKIPSNVSDDQASFTVISSIALQGIRVLNPTLGESIVVIGLGLLGQITMDLLKSMAVTLLVLILIKIKLILLKKDTLMFLTHQKKCRCNYSRNYKINRCGCSNNYCRYKSNSPIENAIEYRRKKGRIIAVGAINMNIPRPLFYEKELEFIFQHRMALEDTILITK